MCRAGLVTVTISEDGEPPPGQSVVSSARKGLAEAECDDCAGIVVTRLRVLGDVLANGIDKRLRFRILRQAEILTNPGPCRATDRVDRVVDAVSSALNVGLAFIA